MNKINKIENSLIKLHKIKQVLNELIDIQNEETYTIKELRKKYYEKNSDVFSNLINAYDKIGKYVQENDKLYGYDIYTENDINNNYSLINNIVHEFKKTNAGNNRSQPNVKPTEKDIYVKLNFEQFVNVDIVSIKDIKKRWNLYSEEEKEKIKKTVKDKFDRNIWVLKDAVDNSIISTEKDKKEYNKELKGQDIDI